MQVTTWLGVCSLTRRGRRVNRTKRRGSSVCGWLEDGSLSRRESGVIVDNVGHSLAWGGSGVNVEYVGYNLARRGSGVNVDYVGDNLAWGLQLGSERKACKWNQTSGSSVCSWLADGSLPRRESEITLSRYPPELSSIPDCGEPLFSRAVIHP